MSARTWWAIPAIRGERVNFLVNADSAEEARQMVAEKGCIPIGHCWVSPDEMEEEQEKATEVLS